MPRYAESCRYCKSLQRLILRNGVVALCPLAHNCCCGCAARCCMRPTLFGDGLVGRGFHSDSMEQHLSAVQKMTAWTALRCLNRWSSDQAPSFF
jgi:hypothetical protein